MLSTKRRRADTFGFSQTLAAHLVARSHGLLLPITHSHHANILYHASPVAQLSPEWTAAAEQDFAPGYQLEAALAVEGVNSLKVTLVKPSKSTVPLSRYLDDSVSSKPEFVDLLAVAECAAC